MDKHVDPPAPPSVQQGDFFDDQPPSFAPATGRSGVARIGVVDVGSNSVRMVVFEGHCRSPAVLYNEKVMCGLGSQLQTTGALDPAGKQR
ncbi:MAG: exopolyphosphatase, partial [Pseudomonadota bacterium]